MERLPTFIGWAKAAPPTTPTRSSATNRRPSTTSTRTRTTTAPAKNASATTPPPLSSPRSPARSRRRLHSLDYGKKSPTSSTKQVNNNTKKNHPWGVPATAPAPAAATHCKSANGNNTYADDQPRKMYDPDWAQQYQHHPVEWTSELEWERTYILKLCQESSAATTAGFIQDDEEERQRRWDEIWHRIQQRPEVIQPVALTTTPTTTFASDSSTSCRCADGDAWNCSTKKEDSVVEKLYARTILGALCSMEMSSSTLTGKVKVENQDGNHDEAKADRTLPITVPDIVRWVLQQCPWQVRCSQVKPGHTPLRDAVCNPTCLPKVLEMLVQADEAVRDGTMGVVVVDSCGGATTATQATINMRPASLLPSVLNLCDTDGLSPVDHLLHMLQLGPYAETTVTRLESLLKHAHVYGEKHELESGKDCDLSLSQQSTPLLQLLTMGNSFGITTGAIPSETSLFSVSPRAGLVAGVVPSETTMRLDRILLCTRLLLRWDPSLIHQTSKTTGCSPLHVAIRNYGNCVPLVREIAERSDRMMGHRNHFGDLPLHVACSVGVPMDILRLVLARTLMVTSPPSSDSPSESPHPLVWSRNNSGYTPVDLEWIRHIEAGHGFFSHRSFYPLDARGVRRPGGRYDDLYDVLLRQAVDQVIVGQTLQTRNASERTAGSSAVTTPVVPSAVAGRRPVNHGNSVSLQLAGPNDSTVGLLLHRIFLVIRASFRDSFSRSPHDLSGDILHQASALSGPHGPTLPRPVLELIFFQHPEQRERCDHAGKLPLHYAVQLCRAHEETSVKSGQEWKLWVQKLLCHAPESCDCRDHQGRLPLHYALEYIAPSSFCKSSNHHVVEKLPPASTSSSSVSTRLLPQEARNSLIKDLVGRSPATIEVVDPVTKLFPYQLAATNPLVSLDTVNNLLRRCPELMWRK